MSKIPEWAEREAAELWVSLGFVNDRLNHLPTIALALVAAEKRGISRHAALLADVKMSLEAVINEYQRLGLFPGAIEIMEAQVAAIRQLGDEE